MSTRSRFVIALLLSALVLVTFDSRGNRVIDFARTSFGVITRPFVVAGDVATRPVRNVWDGMTEVGKLREENAALRDQLDVAAADLIAAENAILEANELKELVGLDDLAGIPKVTGDIVGDSPSNFEQRVELGIGSDQGVRVGMPVVAGGLVGKVTSVSPTDCQVMLVSDPQYFLRVKIISSPDSVSATTVPVTTPSGIPLDDLEDAAAASSTSTTSTVVPEGESTLPTSSTAPENTVVPAGTTAPETTIPETTAPPTVVEAIPTTTVARYRETGSLHGNGADRLPSISFVYSTQQFGQIEVGDVVLSTGGSKSLAPPNIPVGRVANIIEDNGVDGVQVEVELTVDLDRLNFLTVLLYQPPTELGSDG